MKPAAIANHLRLLRAAENQVVAWKARADAPKDVEQLVPLLKDRGEQGVATTYICENFTCRAPIVGARVLREFL